MDFLNFWRSWACSLRALERHACTPRAPLGGSFPPGVRAPRSRWLLPAGAAPTRAGVCCCASPGHSGLNCPVGLLTDETEYEYSGSEEEEEEAPEQQGEPR